MSEASLVRVKSESGRWSKVVRIDDELFADILAPLVDLGEQNEELQLYGATSEVIEREWPSVERLLQLMKKDYFDDMMALIPPTVALREISMVSRILNLPKDWQLYVHATPSDEGYLDFLEAVARAGPVFHLNDYNAAARYVIEMSKLGAGPYLFDVMRATLRNSMISGPHRLVNPSISQVDWEAVITIADRREMRLIPMLSNSLLTLAGRGDHDADTVRSHVTTFWSDGNLIPTTELHLADTYEVAMKSLPENVDPKLMFVEGTLEPYPSWSPFRNRIVNVVPWVHSNFSEVQRLSIGDKRLVDLLDERIAGRRGILRILIAILLAMDKDVDVGPDMARLATNIEERLEEVPEAPKLIDELPMLV